MFLRQVHLELCKVSKIVCTIFGVQIAWEIGIIIIFLTGIFYNFYVRYIMHQYKVEGFIEETFSLAVLSFLNILKAIFLSRICKKAADEVIYLVHHCLIIDFN